MHVYTEIICILEIPFDLPQSTTSITILSILFLIYHFYFISFIFQAPESDAGSSACACVATLHGPLHPASALLIISILAYRSEKHASILIHLKMDTLLVGCPLIMVASIMVTPHTLHLALGHQSVGNVKL